MAKDTKEVDWTKDISSESICTYYYYVFIITAVLGGLVLIWQFSLMARYPKSATLLLSGMPGIILGVVNALFLYIICSRALLK
jgi:hypothetical protein